MVTDASGGGGHGATGGSVSPPAPLVIDLADPRAADPALTGAKAANLARCAERGLPTLPGFVITTAATPTLDGVSAHESTLDEDLSAARTRLTERSGEPLVVRSSSTAEDLETSSMAGQFESVLDVCGRKQFFAAVRDVVRSAERTTSSAGATQAMAVLVQRQLDIEIGGVLFGIDPMSGDRDHLVVEVVPTSVDDLVSGRVTAAHYVLSRHGRIVDRSRADAAPALTASLRRRLASLARDASAALGPAQDIEWAVDRDDRLWLLQSRPVTAVAERPGSARVFGPGPLAETFPRPLRRLEEDLWVAPLRDGIERALRACGAVSDADLDDSPIVVTVDGWAAMDLELTGIVAGTSTLRRRMKPVQILRRLATSWRVGRLRVALPQLAEGVLAAVDVDLRQIPPVDQLDPETVLELLARARRELATVHQYEVLAGMLLHHETDDLPATLVALEALQEARRRGLSDSEAIGRWPVLLSLTPPSLSSAELPPSTPAPVRGEHAVEALNEREALRLRSRWLQELLAIAARSLARRLAESGKVAEPGLVQELTLDELTDAVQTDTVPDDLEQRRTAADGAPLPSRFRLTASGGVVPTTAARHATSGLPAAPGRVVGRARHGVAPGTPKGGIVLVTQHLHPSLAPVLPSLDALVAETGSSLSHLAILAREIGLPVVVGVDGACRRFSPGTRLLVDGSVGDVHELPEDHPAADPEAVP